MGDLGTGFTDDALEKVEGQIGRIYRQASKDVDAKLRDFTERHKAREAVLRANVAAGKMTQDDFDAWMRGQVFQGQMWEARKAAIDAVLLHADEAAANVINTGRIGVFAENANYIGYNLEQGLGVTSSFTLYNDTSVVRLFREHPDMLPRPTVEKAKAYGYYNRTINNCITQGIIQGESIDKIARRISDRSGETNYKSAVRNARTAMTGAQNAGRIEGMRQAEKLGIDVQKQWVAVLDNRTRDAHAELDGQIRDKDQPFDSALGPIMYPGDSGADPANVWNCRCSIIDYYPKYPSYGAERLDNETGEILPDMTYKEWRTAKEKGALPELSEYKRKLSEATKNLLEFDTSQVFKGIFPGVTVTAADYPKLKGEIEDRQWEIYERISRYKSSGDIEAAEQWMKKLDALAEFERIGKEYEKVWAAKNAAQIGVKEFLESLETRAVHAETSVAANVSKLLGKTANLYTPEQQETLRKMVENASGPAREVWEKMVPRLEEPLQDLENPQAALFRASDGRVHFNAQAVANGTTISVPFQTHFHEYFHNIDCLCGSTLSYMSETYIDPVTGKTFDQMLQQESLAAVKKYFTSGGAEKLGLGGYTYTEAMKAGWDKSILSGFERDMKARYSLTDRANISDMFEKFAVTHNGHAFPFGAGHGTVYAKTPGKRARESFAEMGDATMANPGSLAAIKDMYPESYRIWEDMLRSVLDR